MRLSKDCFDCEGCDGARLACAEARLAEALKDNAALLRRLQAQDQRAAEAEAALARLAR
jgi:hypothetical protein